MTISTLVRRIAKLLQQRDLKVVFAESCTGGQVAGALTRVPGISQHHCGGMVLYRNATKQAYLGISPARLKKHGPVSAEITGEMAWRVLERTPEADVAAAVTGHLGPGAPHQLDGIAYIAIAVRPLADSKRQGNPARKVRQTLIHKHQCRAGDERLARQREVVEEVLAQLANALAEL